MSITIKPEDLKAGDRIRVTKAFEYTVREPLDLDGDFRVEGSGWVDASDFESFELISRPHPKLPTEYGSVVRVKDLAGDKPDGTWLVKVDGDLVSAAGIVKSPEDFLGWLYNDNFTFEVIA